MKRLNRPSFDRVLLQTVHNANSNDRIADTLAKANIDYDEQCKAIGSFNAMFDTLTSSIANVYCRVELDIEEQKLIDYKWVNAPAIVSIVESNPLLVLNLLIATRGLDNELESLQLDLADCADRYSELVKKNKN